MINAIADFFQTLFSPIVSVLGVVLLYFHQTLGAPWWLSIVLLTVIVRSLLFPLTIKQVRSMRAMQDLKPHMDRVRAQFKDNPQRQREEMAKVYQEQGADHLGGNHAGCHRDNREEHRPAAALADAPPSHRLYYIPPQLSGRAVRLLDHLEPGNPLPELRHLQLRSWQEEDRWCQGHRE